MRLLFKRGPKAPAEYASVDIPAPTLAAVGWSNVGRHQCWLEDDGVPVPITDVAKPAYRIPLMPEIVALPRNGLNVVSTFSGCGGSCLGFEMAGYTVRYANEFIPAAQEVYRLNHQGVPLDTRDIRTVQPQDILDMSGLKPGEIDVLEGSPPCSSFSTAGKREKSWGKVKAYSDSAQRSDDLFWEYARLLKGLQPRAFVAENVSGLIKGSAKGYFLEILAALKDCGYRVSAYVLDAQWLRRICGFPDDFQLTGTYAQQWERLGRAVPPPMMRAVAEVLRDEVLL